MGNAYTLELPQRMRTHPTFHVGRLRPYCQYEDVSRRGSDLRVQGSRPPSSGPVSASHFDQQERYTAHAAKRCPEDLPLARHEANESCVRSRVAQLHTRHYLASEYDHIVVVVLHSVVKVTTPVSLMLQIIALFIPYAMQLIFELVQPSGRANCSHLHQIIWWIRADIIASYWSLL